MSSWTGLVFWIGTGTYEGQRPKAQTSNWGNPTSVIFILKAQFVPADLCYILGKTVYCLGDRRNATTVNGIDWKDISKKGRRAHNGSFQINAKEQQREATPKGILPQRSAEAEDYKMQWQQSQVSPVTLIIRNYQLRLIWWRTVRKDEQVLKTFLRK